MKYHFFSTFRFLLMPTLFFLISSVFIFGQQTEVILQKGHESSPVQSAAISADHKVMATVDYSGKVILWDIPTGLQLDEVQTNLFSSSDIQFDPSGNRKVLVDNKRNQVLSLDFDSRKAGIRFFGKSLKCEGRSSNNSNMAAQRTVVDPCKSVQIQGSLAAQNSQYIFATDLNELYICKLNPERLKYNFEDLANLNYVTIPNDKLVRNPRPVSKSPPSKTPSKSKMASEAPPRSTYNPNNALKSFDGWSEEKGGGFFNFPVALVYNEKRQQMAYRDYSSIALLGINGQQKQLIRELEVKRRTLSWISPTADYAGLLEEDQFLWIKLEDGTRTTMPLPDNGRAIEMKVFPDQNRVLIIWENQLLELYDFKQQKRLFQRQFTASCSGLTLSEDGQYLVTFHGEKGVYLWNITHNTLERIFNAAIPEITQFQLTTKEDQLFTFSEHREIYSLQLGGSFAFRNLLPADALLEKGLFSPDGQMLLWTIRNKNNILHVSNNGQSETIEFGQDFQIDKLFFAPHGRQFAVASRMGHIHVFDRGEMTRLAKFPPLGFEINHLALHPEKPLMAVAFRDKVKLVDWDKGPPEDWSKAITSNDDPDGDILFGREKVGGTSNGSNDPYDPGDLIYVEFSPSGQYMTLRGAPQASILKLGDNNELQRLFPNKEANFPGVFAMGLINKAFSSSIYSPIFMDNEQQVLFESKDKNKIEIWAFAKVSNYLTQFKGDRNKFPGSPVHTIDTEDIPYQSFTVMRSQPIIIFNCGNQGLKLVNYEKNQLLVTIYPVNEQKMLMINPDLNYYTTFKGYDLLAFKRGDKVYPLEQFDLQFNRPDKVLKNIGLSPDSLVSAYYRAYQKRLEKLDFTEDMIQENFDLPELKILTPNLPSSTTDANLQFLIRASDQKEKLDRLQVYINDVPVFGRRGIKLRRKNTQVHEQPIDLTLTKGINKIQASVLNRAGAESLKETFYITYEDPEQQSDLYFVGIGVSEYAQADKNLKYPVKDIEDLAALLTKDSTNFSQIHIHLLKNKEVTVEGIQSLKNVLMQTRINDRVIIFFAGHGLLDKDLDYYLASYDVNFENPKVNGILYSVFENLLDSIPSRFKLSMMDACHSGEIDKENVKVAEESVPQEAGITFRSTGPSLTSRRVGLQNSFELMKEIFVDLRRNTGATTISSASGGEFAIEGELWNNSIFMYCLLKGLKEKEADLDNDGSVMVSELQQYLSSEVFKLTNGGQRPTMRIENIANDWRVW